MLCNSLSYARTASCSVMAIESTPRAAVKCYSMNPRSSTIVSLSSLMARRRWYLYVSTEQAAPRRPEEPCRDSGSFNTSNRIAAQYSKDSNSNQQVRCALLAPWFMPMGKESTYSPCQRIIANFMIVTVTGSGGMDLSFPIDRHNYSPWKSRLVLGPVIVPLKIGQAFQGLEVSVSTGFLFLRSGEPDLVYCLGYESFFS